MDIDASFRPPGPSLPLPVSCESDSSVDAAGPLPQRGEDPHREFLWGPFWYKTGRKSLFNPHTCVFFQMLGHTVIQNCLSLACFSRRPPLRASPPPTWHLMASFCQSVPQSPLLPRLPLWSYCGQSPCRTRSRQAGHMGTRPRRDVYKV